MDNEIEKITSEINDKNSKLFPINNEYNELLSDKAETEKKLLDSSLNSNEISYYKGVLEGINIRLSKVNDSRQILINEINELNNSLTRLKEDNIILTNSLEENEKIMDKMKKELQIAENNSKEILEEIEYYKTRMNRESFSIEEKEKIVNSIKSLEQKYDNELKRIKEIQEKITKTQGLIARKTKIPSNPTSAEKTEKSVEDEQIESKPMEKDGYIPADTIPEGRRIIVSPVKEIVPSAVKPEPFPPMPEPAPTFPVTPEPSPVSPVIPNDDNKPVEVVQSEKKPNFLTKHKKAILIAGGLAALTAAAVLTVPPLAAAMMYGNSVLYGAVANVPFIGGALQAALHASNAILSPLAGALGGFSAGAGTWTTATGYVINSGVASAGIADAIGAAIVNGTITVGATLGFRKLTKKLKESFKKTKDKEKIESPTSIPEVSPIDETEKNEEDKDLSSDKNYYELLGFNPSEKEKITPEQLNANLIKINSEILKSNDKNSLIKLKKLMEAYKTLTDPKMKQIYDESMQEKEESEGRMMK